MYEKTNFSNVNFETYQTNAVAVTRLRPFLGAPVRFSKFIIIIFAKVDCLFTRRLGSICLYAQTFEANGVDVLDQVRYSLRLFESEWRFASFVQF